MATYKDLLSQADALRSQAELIRETERQATIDKIRILMKEQGLTIKDITTPELRSRSQSKNRAPAKYRGPNGEEWAGGRGRKPDWVRKVLAAGRTLDEYAI